MPVPYVPELVGYVEIAALVRPEPVSRQRARTIALEDQDFPPIVAHPASGPLYLKEHVEVYFAERDNKPGPKTNHSTNAQHA